MALSSVNPPKTPETPESGMSITVPAAEFPAKYDPYTEAGSYDALSDQADTVFGFDLAKDELADALCGVEFIVVAMTFRPGTIKDALQYAYVSLETVVSPRLHIARINMGRRASGGRDAGLPDLTSIEELPFEPGSHVVINDGSTGIYRQAVQYLYAKQFISLPGEITEGGEHGTSSFDLPPSAWSSVNPHIGYIAADESGFIGATVNVRLKCPRGLRLSRYPNPSNPKEISTTRYFG
jgi:hypothetical protein